MERVVFVCNDNISYAKAALPPQDHHNVAVAQGVTHAVSVDYRQAKDKPVYAKYNQAYGKPEQAVPFIHSHIVLAVYDVLAARIRALHSEDQGRQNVGGVSRGNGA
jgi:hypothetical protein